MLFQCQQSLESHRWEQFLMDREYAMVRQFDHRLVSNWDQHPILFLKRERKVIQKRTFKSFQDKIVLPGLRPLSLLVNRLRFCWHSVKLAIRSTVSTLNEIISWKKTFFYKVNFLREINEILTKNLIAIEVTKFYSEDYQKIIWLLDNQILLFGISLCLHFAKQMYLFTFFDKH